jgi:hypothetical protein
VNRETEDGIRWRDHSLIGEKERAIAAGSLKKVNAVDEEVALEKAKDSILEVRTEVEEVRTEVEEVRTEVEEEITQVLEI